MANIPTLILVNPWITDFAAYDLWSKPLGLLILAGELRHRGYRVHLIDCLDVHHPGMAGKGSAVRPVRRAYGTGKFWRTVMDPPAPLISIPRPYSRYGISRDLFVEALEAVKNPAAALVTSLMTYWYPGVREAVSLIRDIHPRTPVILGGIYASLCRNHAVRHSGADRVVSSAEGNGLEAACRILDAAGVPRPSTISADTPVYPAYDMLRRPDSVCITTSTGCPYRCGYCASGFLNPSFKQRHPHAVIDEILHWHETLGIRDIAFYDDALLVKAHAHIRPVLKELTARAPNLRFHTPNALHLREITIDTARLLHHSGFRTVRLGLETVDFEFRRGLDGKVRPGEFERAVQNLREAGYGRREIGVYVMMGLPGQSMDSVKKTLKAVDRAGAVPFLAEYSPIPHTALWPEAVAESAWDLNEPLFQNNTLLPCWSGMKQARAPELRALARDIRGPRDQARETL